MFEGQSPENYEQKCLCVLVLDISGSMSGEPMHQLNKGLQEFQQAVLQDFVASQRLEISLVTFGNEAKCVQEPALAGMFQMPTLIANGSTKLVEGMRLAMSLVENRKTWYKDTGQNYYRPMVVVITDGEPDPDQDIRGLANEIGLASQQKKAMFYALGVKGYNHTKLSSMFGSPPPLPLDGYKFSEFFTWLSNSIGIITKSKEGDMLSLPPVSGWSQIQM